MIAGIVLAAGSSSRLGRPKQLLLLRGEPLLRVTIQRVLGTRIDSLYVILRRSDSEIAASISDLPVQIVENPVAASGQSTSVLAGLRAIEAARPQAAIFLLGDQPQVDPELVDALIATWERTRAGVVVPRYTDGVGNPILFDRRVFPEFESLRGDVGARQIVRAHQERGDLAAVDVQGPAPQDVDTEADYLRLLASFEIERPGVPPCIDFCAEPE